MMLEQIYELLDAVLPYSWLSYTFMKNALLAVLIVTPLFGLLSTMVVSNKMAFFSDSLGHGAFTGVAIGALIGSVKPLMALVLFSAGFAVVITWIKWRSKASTDTVIGVFSSVAIALGLTIMSRGGGINKFTGFLIGDLLSITEHDLLGLLLIFALVIAVWLKLFNKLLIASINTSLAASRGFKPFRQEMIFAALLAVVVSVSIQWVGLLLINSLLVLPAASARNVTNNARQYHLVSVLISLFAGVAGLATSYYAGTAAGATIVLAAAGCFFITLLLKPHCLN